MGNFDLAMSLVRRQPDKQNRGRGNLAAYELCPSNMAFLVRPRITSIFFESLRGCISLGPSGGILPPSGIGRKLSHIHSALSFGIRATELHTSCAQTDIDIAHAVQVVAVLRHLPGGRGDMLLQTLHQLR